MPPGFTGEFAVTLTAGKYTLYCPGATPERRTITVTGQAVGRPTDVAGPAARGDRRLHPLRRHAGDLAADRLAASWPPHCTAPTSPPPSARTSPPGPSTRRSSRSPSPSSSVTTTSTPTSTPARATFRRPSGAGSTGSRRGCSSSDTLAGLASYGDEARRRRRTAADPDQGPEIPSRPSSPTARRSCSTRSRPARSPARRSATRTSTCSTSPSTSRAPSRRSPICSRRWPRSTRR